MLQAPVSEKKLSLMSGARPQPRSRIFAPPVYSFSNQSRLQTLQKKSDCACGGDCSECKSKSSGSQMGFLDELEDNTFQQLPDETPPTGGPVETGPSDAEPLQGGGGGGSNCSSLCDRAYASPALNYGGGGVVCERGTMCPCVFDVAPLRRGQCPGFDAVVLAHERRHMPESICPANAPLSRLGPPPGVDRTAVECIHRRESIAEIDAIIPGAAGICKTGMEQIRARLAAWVAANCGAP